MAAISCASTFRLAASTAASTLSRKYSLTYKPDWNLKQAFKAATVNASDTCGELTVTLKLATTGLWSETVRGAEP